MPSRVEPTLAAASPPGLPLGAPVQDDETFKQGAAGREHGDPSTPLGGDAPPPTNAAERSARRARDATPSGSASSDLSPTRAWSRRVRRVGGAIQVAFAGFWLFRGSNVIGGAASEVLIALSAVAVLGTVWYGIVASAGVAPRPHGAEARRIERAVTLATVIEFAAALALPVLVTSAGHSDWVLPSIAITIGPLLLWLDRRLDLPRYRPVGWALTIGPVVLVATMSGTALIATTGIASGMLLLGTAMAGFHDLAQVQRGGRADTGGHTVATAAVRT
jgi:hypothetical protein